MPDPVQTQEPASPASGSETPPETTPPGQSTTEETPPAVETPQTGQTPDDSQAHAETPAPAQPPVSPPGYQQDVDEHGVPYKNRYLESQRKLDKMSEQINTLSQKIESSSGQKGGEYSIEELEAFMETEAGQIPANRNWARGEIRRLNKESNAKVVKDAINEWKGEQEAEKTRSGALQTVIARHPTAFKKDANGKFVGWDPNSPLAQRIGFYMQDPEIKNNPRGLLVAAALAYEEVSQGQSVKTQATTTKLKTEVKDLQKKTLTEGGGVSSPPPPKTPLDATKEKLAQSGNIKDGAAAFKEVLKRKGRIKED